MDKKQRLQQLNKKSYEVLEQEFDSTRFKPWKEIEPIVDRMKQGSSVLDLGCGNGRLLHALSRVNLEYTGIDSNAYLLSKAKKHWPHHSFEQSDMETVELPVHSYDYIFSIASFHHIVGDADRLVLLKKCYDALKSDGVMILSVWRLWQLKYIPYIFLHASWKCEWNDFFIPWKRKTTTTWRYYHGFTEAELKGLLEKVGFKVSFVQGSRNGQLVKRGYNIIVQAKK